ncbi:MAG: hypothetical protein K9W44_13395 [Candidatus Lokiarchaeota archaeon]|nr:hypothetical protein [Candidatus Harpocratesius repetitus]
MTVLLRSRKKLTCCSDPKIKNVDGFRTCVNCGTVVERIQIAEQNFSQYEILQKFSQKKRKVSLVEKKILEFNPVIPRTLQMYQSIPNRRILSGYPAKCIIAAIGFYQCEHIFFREQNWSIKDLFLISQIYGKIGGKGPIAQNFMYQILSNLQSQNTSKNEKKYALRILRHYYKRLLLLSKDNNELRHFVDLSQNLITSKNFSFFIGIAEKIINKPIPNALGKKEISNSIFYKIKRWISLKTQEFRIFFLKIKDVLKNVTCKHTGEQTWHYNNFVNNCSSYHFCSNKAEKKSSKPELLVQKKRSTSTTITKFKFFSHGSSKIRYTNYIEARFAPQNVIGGS